MPGPRPQPIVLTHRQRETLEHLTRRRSSTQGLVRRARIVLAASEGHNNEQIARRLRINRETARLWRRVWSDAQELLGAAEEGEEETSEKALRKCVEEVLADAPRSGAPATFTPEQVVQIVALACEAPREGSGRPSFTGRLGNSPMKPSNGASYGASRYAAWGVFWGEVDLKPHRMRYWLNNERSAEPEVFKHGG